jgi:hypothetical protein
LKLYVAILLGGFVGPDGYATSAGMYQLPPVIHRQFPTATVEVFQWGAYRRAAAALKRHRKEKTVVIGYSGGGSRTTWIKDARIDVAVLYDPSPRWQMLPLGKNIIRAVCYENSTPLFFGLGAGKCVGRNVKHVPIAEPHLIVQSDQALHRQTIREIAK